MKIFYTLLYKKFNVTPLIFFLIVTFTFNLIFAQSKYVVKIVNGSYINENEFQFDVKLSSIDSVFELTSFQCAFDLAFSDNNFIGLEFNYIDGSADYSIIPSYFIERMNSNNTARLVFASLPGSDLVSKKENSIGKFIIKRLKKFNETNAKLTWNFEGVLNTILTGQLFTDITDSTAFENNFSILSTRIFDDRKLSVFSVEAGSTTERNNNPFNTIDGKGFYSGAQHSKWVVNYLPASLIFDLGKKKSIHKTRLSFDKFNLSKTYKYSIQTSLKKYKWTDILPETGSEAKEWTERIFTPVVGRYLKLNFLLDSTNLNNKAGLWEAEIWGDDLDSSTTRGTDKKILSKFNLNQNYPNPFNPSTTISFELKEDGHVTLEIFNMLGQKITELINGQLSEGLHKIIFNANKLTSGTYIYRINVDNKFIDSKRMILIK